MAIYHIKPDRPRAAGWRILALGDIECYVEVSFLIFIGAIVLINMQGGSGLPALSRAGLFGFIIFFSLLAHEAGHAIMARLMGYRDIVISLVAFGGNTRHPPATRGQALAIVLAGPAVTLALVGTALLLARSEFAWVRQEVSVFVLQEVFIINLFWAVFNLLPIFPMDGGQALYRTLSFMMRDARAILITAFVSLAVCAGLGAVIVIGVLGPPQSLLILIIFILTFVQQNVQIIRGLWGRS